MTGTLKISDLNHFLAHILLLNNPTSAKIFYFLLQIAHMLAQLLEKGDLLKKAFPAGFGSEKNLAFRLLEAWRNARLTKNAIEAMLRARFQIRFYFDTS